MRWWEVVSGCDGYYTPRRFQTEEQADTYVEYIQIHSEDIHVSEGPYEVNTEDKHFYSEEARYGTIK